MNCWICGAEPVEVHIIAEQERSIVTYVRWPDSADHDHVEHPPTPEQLTEAGHAALLRILEQWRVSD